MSSKIMVVDDDRHIVDYLVTVFSDNGYETCAAYSGAEAMEVLEREKPDLISLDLDMPEDAGPKFYRNMTRNKEYESIPVIVVSGLPGPHRAIKKAAAVVSKPFDPDRLIAIVRETLAD